MNAYWKRTLVLIPMAGAGLTDIHASESFPVDTGATAWMLTSVALVLLMIPGLAMFYGGLVRSKNVLGTIMHSFVAMGIITVLWVIVGYSMCFGGGILEHWPGWSLKASIRVSLRPWDLPAAFLPGWWPLPRQPRIRPWAAESRGDVPGADNCPRPDS